MTITRYNIGTRHHNGIGFPGEMVKQADGEYVRHDDYLEAHRQIAALTEDYADMAAKNAELERQLEAIGAGGVSLMGRAALQSQNRESADWMACESRRPWVTNSLKTRATELRDAEKRCRNAFNKDYMGDPSRYVADTYGKAAAVIEAKLDAIDSASRRIKGDAK